MKKKTPGELVLEALGGPSATARIFGISPWAASKWRKRIPAERVIKLEKVTGINRRILRPDLYPDD